MKKLVFLFLLLTILPSKEASAQIVINPGEPFTVAWDYKADLGTIKFRLWCDKAIVKNYAANEVLKSATPNGDGSFTYTATAPILFPGGHACYVTAYSEAGESDPSNQVDLFVGTKPSAPMRLRVVISSIKSQLLELEAILNELESTNKVIK